MWFQSDSRNDHKRGVKADANPMTLCLTLREAFLCFNVLSDPNEVSLIRRSLKKFFLASILMQYLTLLTHFLSHFLVNFSLFFVKSWFVIKVSLKQYRPREYRPLKSHLLLKKEKSWQDKLSFSVCHKMQKIKSNFRNCTK